MKTNKINRKMLVTVLTVSSLLLLSGIALVAAQNDKTIIDEVNSPLYLYRTNSATVQSTDVKVDYVAKETISINDESQLGTPDGQKVLSPITEGWICTFFTACTTSQNSCYGTCEGSACSYDAYGCWKKWSPGEFTSAPNPEECQIAWSIHPVMCAHADI